VSGRCSVSASPFRLASGSIIAAASSQSDATPMRGSVICWPTGPCGHGRFTAPREKRVSRGEPSSGPSITSMM
jgi:hypothetical protein